MMASPTLMAGVPNELVAMVNGGTSSPLSDGALLSPSLDGNIAAQMLTIRMLMSGKEVGSIIGKKGDNVKKYREESGARINISDGSCPERIVTVTGTVDQIHIAFSMMCQKFEDDFTQSVVRVEDGVACPPVTLRLLVPATQCGSVIGKGGCKIKEIRELTGASIQVASEVLPNSSERTVTISGNAKAIAKCIRHLCHILLESPPKGATIPYRPKPALPPGMPTSIGIPMPGGPLQLPPGALPTGLPPPNGAGLPAGMPMPAELAKGPPAGPGHSGGPMSFLPTAQNQSVAPASLLQAPTGDPFLAGGALSGAGMALGHPMPSLRPSGPAPPAPTQTQEMSIPNDLIGCIIGRGGTKINEIRQLSGAQIKISNCEDGTKERRITITGTPETIQAAQYFINSSIELHKHLLALNMAVSTGMAPLPGNLNQLLAGALPAGLGPMPGGLPGGLPGVPNGMMQGLPSGLPHGFPQGPGAGLPGFPMGGVPLMRGPAPGNLDPCGVLVPADSGIMVSGAFSSPVMAAPAPSFGHNKGHNSAAFLTTTSLHDRPPGFMTVSSDGHVSSPSSLTTKVKHNQHLAVNGGITRSNVPKFAPY